MSFSEKAVYRLSDSYLRPAADGAVSLELVVTVYNINKGNNEVIVKRSENLYGYVTFVSSVRDFEQNGMEREKAVERAIKDCIDRGILVDYLNNNASEVSNMLLQEWNMDDAIAYREREAVQTTRAEYELRLAEKDAAHAAALAEISAENARLKAQLGQK